MKRVFRSMCLVIISSFLQVESVRVNSSEIDKIPWKPIPGFPPVNRRGFISSASDDSVSFPSPTPNIYSQPVLKQRDNGASLGLDIPESNLRLWLNIDELSGPKSNENIRLKLLDSDLLAKSSSAPRYAAPLVPPLPPSAPTGPSVTLPTTTLASIGNKKYQIGYIRATDLHTALNSGVLPRGAKAYQMQPPPPVFVSHNTMRQQPQPSQSASQHPHLFALPLTSPPPSPSTLDLSPHPSRHHPRHPSTPEITSNSNSGGVAQPIIKYSQPLQSDSLPNTEKHVNNYPSSNSVLLDPHPFLPINQVSPPAVESSSSTSGTESSQGSVLSVAESNSKSKTRPSSPVKSARKKARNNKGSSARKTQQLQEVPTTSTTTTTTTTEKASTTSESPIYKADLRFEQQKQSDISDEQNEDVQEIQVQNNQEQIRDEQDEDFGLMQAQIKEEPTSTTTTTTTTSTTTERSAAIKGIPPPRAPVKGSQRTISSSSSGTSARIREANSVDDEDKHNSETEEEHDDGFELLRMSPRNQASTSSSHVTSCSPDAQSFSGDADSMTIREFASKLGADTIFSKFPAMEDHLQNMVDFMNSGYTLFLPSNEAVERIPRSLIRKLKADPEMLKKMLENHISEDKRDMNDLRGDMVMPARASSGRLRVSRRSSTDVLHVNGIRVVKANQKGPMGGSVNVIDGFLYPVSDRNLMDTLKSCNRFDGFVTLAEGTGLGESLASGGPYTVFVPSNEALQKIPDSDLDRIRNNMTALKEFLMYHVALGSYYSADLRDGQFIPSMIPDQDLQVGVRVDGCSRRLVEANVSPLYRADIPATNGVIHVVDWILKPNDRDWCEGVELPRRR